MNKYHIYHRSDPGFHIVTIQAEDDEAFMHMLDTGAIPEIAQYTYLQVYTENNPQSTYPDIITRKNNKL